MGIRYFLVFKLKLKVSFFYEFYKILLIKGINSFEFYRKYWFEVIFIRLFFEFIKLKLLNLIYFIKFVYDCKIFEVRNFGFWVWFYYYYNVWY